MRHSTVPCFVFVFHCLLTIPVYSAAQLVVPGWTGDPIVTCNGDDSGEWSVEWDSQGASASIELIDDGFEGGACRLNWDMGQGQWAQATYTFAAPAMDLSQYDLFGITFRSEAAEQNKMSFMLEDVNGVFYLVQCENIIGIGANRWMVNQAIPRASLNFAWGPQREFDWTQVRRLFVAVIRGNGTGGGSGTLDIDGVQVAVAADWPRATAFDSASPNMVSADLALDYLLSAQESSGLVKSWGEEVPPKSYLYDQSVALFAFVWAGWFADPANESARTAAHALARFLIENQKNDGHWARVWDSISGAEEFDDGWVGDQAAAVIALAWYFAAVEDCEVWDAAQKGSSWLADRIEDSGQVVADDGGSNTEGTIFTWFAMIATQRLYDAGRIDSFVRDKLWDNQLRYLHRGFSYTDSKNDPTVALDANSMGANMFRSPWVNDRAKALDALSFVRRALVTSSADGLMIGIDGAGPVTVLAEFTARYIAAGGIDGDEFLTELSRLQFSDGALPGAPESIDSCCHGWWSVMRGAASTAWYYAANTHSMLHFTDDDEDGRWDVLEQAIDNCNDNGGGGCHVRPRHQIQSLWRSLYNAMR